MKMAAKTTVPKYRNGKATKVSIGHSHRSNEVFNASVPSILRLMLSVRVRFGGGFHLKGAATSGKQASSPTKVINPTAMKSIESF